MKRTFHQLQLLQKILIIVNISDLSDVTVPTIAHALRAFLNSDDCDSATNTTERIPKIKYATTTSILSTSSNYQPRLRLGRYSKCKINQLDVQQDIYGIVTNIVDISRFISYQSPYYRPDDIIRKTTKCKRNGFRNGSWEMDKVLLECSQIVEQNSIQQGNCKHLTIFRYQTFRVLYAAFWNMHCFQNQHLQFIWSVGCFLEVVMRTFKNLL